MAAWFDRIAIYGPAPPNPKKKEEKELLGLLPDQEKGAAGSASGAEEKAAKAPRPSKKPVSSADCWLPGYEYLMTYYLHPRETPRCKYTNTVFRPLALHDIGGCTGPRPKTTPTPPNPIWSGPSPIAQGAVPEHFGKRHREKRSSSGRKQHAGGGGSKSLPPRRILPGEEEDGDVVWPQSPPEAFEERRRPRRAPTPAGERMKMEAWATEAQSDTGTTTTSGVTDRFSVRSTPGATGACPATGRESAGARKEDSRAFRFVRKLYNNAHRENFALKKIAEQERQVYGEEANALGGGRAVVAKKGKRKLPGWLSGKKETLCNDGSHFAWVCQY